ncbi:MAG: hypothetical protein EHM72_09085 [Calditrichaeota bacterium]|nr:MAG: hypothetical protein EHM72_09085 [Calditrichota bacterium]
MSIKLERSYYASLCWFGLKQIGFGGEAGENNRAELAALLTAHVGGIGFQQPIACGPFLKLIYQIPASINPKNPEELALVFSECQELIATGSLEGFTDRWPKLTRYWDQWYYPQQLSSLLKPLVENKAAVMEAMQLWENYMREIWPDYEELYQEKLKDYPFEEYQDKINSLNLLERWKTEFGVEYPYSEFRVVICPETPTLACDLGPEKIVAGSRYDLANLENAVAHQLGVRYPALNRIAEAPATKLLMNSDFEGMVKLIETEVCVRKLNILPQIGNDGFVTAQGLQSWVNWRVKIEPDSTFEDSLPALYQQAKDAGLL